MADSKRSFSRVALLVPILCAASVSSATALPRSVALPPRTVPLNLCTLTVQSRLTPLDLTGGCTKYPTTTLPTATYGGGTVFSARWRSASSALQLQLQVWSGLTSLASSFENHWKTIGRSVAVGSSAREDAGGLLLAAWANGAGIVIDIIHAPPGAVYDAPTLALAKAIAQQI